MKVSFHPAARRELLKHSKWYRDRSLSAATGFEREIDHAVSRIADAPERYPLTRRNRRRFVLLEYPFDVVDRIRENEIQIIAIAHHSRRPEYWLHRTESSCLPPPRSLRVSRTARDPPDQGQLAACKLRLLRCSIG